MGELEDVFDVAPSVESGFVGLGGVGGGANESLGVEGAL
jgi:hypothetical protein